MREPLSPPSSGESGFLQYGDDTYNVVIGTFLFQGIVTMTPTVMNSAIHMDMSEVIRVIASQGMILYALTRKTEGSK